MECTSRRVFGVLRQVNSQPVQDLLRNDSMQVEIMRNNTLLRELLKNNTVAKKCLDGTEAGEEPCSSFRLRLHSITDLSTTDLLINVVDHDSEQ